jgi:nicotinate-nucleotide adenylyltransferase
MRIGIFGGTFDPPHFGHLAVAEAAKEKLQLDEVIFVPANRNPLKKGKSATAKQRMEMVKLAIGDRPGFAISDSEISRGGPSYAVDTVSELQYVTPGEYWFILGADALRTLPNWRQPGRLLRLCRLATTLRAPMTAEDVFKYIPEDYRKFIDIFEMKPTEISGSEIRDKLAKGSSISLWVPQPVIKYIQENKLYRI